jgi:hypothetical protein
MTFTITSSNPQLTLPPATSTGAAPIVITIAPVMQAVVESGNATLVND